MKVVLNSPKRLIVEDNPVWGAVPLGIAFLVCAFGVVHAIATRNTTEAFGVAFIASGVTGAMLYRTARRVQIILDGPQNLIEFRARTLKGFEVKSYPLADLKEASVQAIPGQHGPSFRPALVLGGLNAGRFPLITTYRHGNNAETIVQTINTWHRDWLDTRHGAHLE